MSPCLSPAAWSHSKMDTCDKFVNGTKDVWYKIKSYVSWCDSFATSCIQSQALRRRCLRELKFYSLYFSFNRAFTVEIISYLSDTRIQISYQCSSFFHYFAVLNIIRCGNGMCYHHVTCISFLMDKHQLTTCDADTIMTRKIMLKISCCKIWS